MLGGEPLGLEKSNQRQPAEDKQDSKWGYFLYSIISQPIRSTQNPNQKISVSSKAI